MSLLSLSGIEKSYGAETVLRGASLAVGPGDRVGLVGRNGCGKTTLLRIMAGLARPDSGRRAAAKGLGIGLLAQEPGAAHGATVLDEMLSARPDVMKRKRELDGLSAEAARLAALGDGGYEKALERYAALFDEFEGSGGYAYENMAAGALRGLGFSEDEFGRGTDTLSGGQRTRLALARLLLGGHGLLLLDEPTNHLDVESIGWLEQFLDQYRGAVLIVSHDRQFLDRAVTRILELESGRIEEYPGNFSAYRAEKEKRAADRLRAYELMSARLEKEKEYINRMRAGVNARQAKGREKRLARLALPDRPAADAKAPGLRWGDIRRSSDTSVAAKDVTKGFDGRTVLEGVSFSIRRGERVGIVGRNGSGKSTLLRIITGELAPDSGEVALGLKVKPAYYAQGLEGLAEASTVLDELWAAEPMAPEQKIRDMLGAFLFTGDDALKKTGELSGGEKGRLAIAKVALTGANLLILDEPTNHLDIPSREALEAALEGYGGTVVAVSHDRRFLDSFTEKTFELRGGVLTEYQGNYSYYAWKKAPAEEEKDAAQAEGRQAWEERKQRQAADKKAGRERAKRLERLSGIEDDIESVEEELRRAEERLADPGIYGDFARLSELTGRYNILKDKRDALYDLLEKEAI